MSNKEPKVIVALDYPLATEAMVLVDQLEPGTCILKVGKELFTRSGPDFVRGVVDRGFRVFLDLKYHDIPNTVARACSAAADLGVWMMNVHAMGGKRMMEAAMEALQKTGDQRPLLIAVTVLTSMDQSDLQGIGIEDSPGDMVKRLAALTQASGLDGVVCSAQEATILREQAGPDFCLVTPGIRPAGSDAGDQRRIMTPVDAIAAGSDYLVIGRPITGAENPMSVLNAINKDLGII